MLNVNQVRGILAQAFPELDVAEVRYLAAGWDFEVWEVDASRDKPVLFRFPFRDDCIVHVHREAKLLPAIANQLPVAVPVPAFESEGCEAFARPFFGYEKIAGTPMSEATLSLEQQVAAGEELGRILSALHSVHIERANELGVELRDATSWREAERGLWERCHRDVLPLLPSEEQFEVDRYFREFLNGDEHFRFEARLTHNDLGMEHVLVDGASGRVTGIIDFGDAEIGDPALDFVGMSAEVRRAAINSYILPLGEAFEERVAYFSKLAPFHDVLFGLGDGGPEHVEAGLTGIRERILERDRAASR
jgi:aminoglycoside 2''-phosphotransferase